MEVGDRRSAGSADTHPKASIRQVLRGITETGLRDPRPGLVRGDLLCFQRQRPKGVYVPHTHWRWS